jgi:hypothetical protein
VKKIIHLTFLLGLCHVSVAQHKDSIVINAMKDELFRNMKELSYEGFEKPFYIHYSINDVTSYEIAASLGALVRSSDNKARSKNVRVLVGNYDFNDESLDNNTFSALEANEIQLPLDNDYYGIRRALWVTTDNVYKGAARKYKRNLETLKEKNKSIAEMPHRRFAASPPIKLFKEVDPYSFDLASKEKFVRELSGIFSNYPDIDYSTVYLSFVDGYDYFVSSEGSVSKTPMRMASLQIFAQRQTESGEAVYDHLSYDGITPDQFPAVGKIREDVKALCEKVTAPLPIVLEEEYSGPVLFIGEPVADLFGSVLFGFRDGLVASDILPDPRGYRQEMNSSIDTKIGKSIIDEQISVSARATLRSFDNTALLGSIYIDDEGTVPPDEVLLVEHGVLRTLLNNRSLLKENETSNGHSSGPAVIEVKVDNGMSLLNLKEKLVAEAKKQGLEYALIFSSPASDPVGGSSVTKIYVKDRKEQLVRGAALQALQLRDLKNILGGSSVLKAHNVRQANQRLASFIVPEALLLEDIEVRKAEIRSFKEERYVSNPLKQ